jgi:hypothetical protein
MSFLRVYGQGVAGAAHPLVERQALEALGQAGAVGQREFQVELEQRHEDEPALGHLRMRQRQALRREGRVAEEQQVDVDRAGPVAHVVGGRRVRRAAVGALDVLASVQELLRRERGGDPHAGVEEVGLVEDLADRVGVVRRGRRQHPHAAGRQGVDGGLELGTAVADVRAEAEVAQGLARPEPGGAHAGTGARSASWRDCASSVPSGWKSVASSSTSPPCAAVER